MTSFTNDLVILVADKDMEETVRGLLSRPLELGIRSVIFRIFIHAWGHDPQCLNNAHAFLQPSIGRYARALVMLDRHGSGQESKSRERLEKTLTKKLSRSGWKNRAAAIVIDPELEQWVWTNCEEVATCLGWPNAYDGMRNFLQGQHLWPAHEVKPSDPKEAYLKAIRASRTKISSKNFYKLGERVAFDGCIDQAFMKFRATLQSWFPA